MSETASLLTSEQMTQTYKKLMSSLTPEMHKKIIQLIDKSNKAPSKSKKLLNLPMTSQCNSKIVEQPSKSKKNKEQIFKSELDMFLENANITKIDGETQINPKVIEILINYVSNSGVKNVLEIGFNAGHFADTFLKSNSNIKLVSFQTENQEWVTVGKKYIDIKYPKRHTLISGDTLKTIPNYIKQNPNQQFDIIFINGGHFNDVPLMDLSNCRELSHSNTIVIMNDVKKKNANPLNVKPTEAWELYEKNNYITTLKLHDLGPKNGLACGKYNLCEVYVCTLLRQDRVKYIELNKKFFPFIKIFNSVNGYDINQTLKEMVALKLKYKDLDETFRTYGTLANWITKYKMLQFQVEKNIPYLCFLEDDLILDKSFYKYINDSLIHFNNKNMNILRLMTWGEGYITSYESAKRLLAYLKKDGIIRNIDNQLRENCGQELGLEKAPMKLMMVGGNGDCGKTKDIDLSKIKKLKY